MRAPASPAAAIGWNFRRRHRWGLMALGAYLVVLTGVKVWITARGEAVTFDSAERFALVVVVPLSWTFTYFLALFSYGLSGDLAARQSMYPTRLFTLPVSNAGLVGWPMLYGGVAMAVLWAATRLLAVWPSGVDIPVVWPAVLAAALLAWTQALTWMPYGLPGLRVIATVLWLATIDGIALLALHFKAPEPVMLAIAAPQIPLAYLAARFAVARARRGMIPDWRVAPAWPWAWSAAVRRPDAFASAARAQAWFEWRRHGRTLPALVAILLPFELGVLFPAGNTPALVIVILLGVLLTPPFMAAFVAATVRQSDLAVREARDAYGLTPFMATRPLTSPALIAAKLKMAAWSTLVTWVIVLAAIPAGLMLSDTWPLALEGARKTVALMGEPRAVVLLLLLVAGCMASTWKQLVQSLYVGLTGRDWLVKASAFAALVFLCLLGPFADWAIESQRLRAAIWGGMPWILSGLVALKMSAAAWVAVRLYDTRLVGDRTLAIGAACWCVAVLALYGVLAWWISSEFFPRYLFLLLAILVVPLARVSAAPLALAWNRHR